jgi:hypothetical protein
MPFTRSNCFNHFAPAGSKVETQPCFCFETDVRFDPQQATLTTSLPMSAMGLGCVKTPKLKFQIESSSRLRQFEKQKR